MCIKKRLNADDPADKRNGKETIQAPCGCLEAFGFTTNGNNVGIGEPVVGTSRNIDRIGTAPVLPNHFGGCWGVPIDVCGQRGIEMSRSRVDVYIRNIHSHIDDVHHHNWIANAITLGMVGPGVFIIRIIEKIKNGTTASQ